MTLFKQYKKNPGVIIATGLAISILVAQGFDNKSGPDCDTDVSSLLQAWVQQPSVEQRGTLGPWSLGVQMKQNPQNQMNPMSGLNSTMDPLGTTMLSDYDYNISEWDTLEPGYGEILLEGKGEGASNLCMYGHFVPEFILLGVVKAATTTFAGTMQESPGVVFPKRKVCEDADDPFCFEGSTAKEGHFFDSRKGNGLKFMAALYPKCRYDMRIVATDMTPRYLADPTVPKTIANWYAPSLSSRLKFIIILREPIARFHSDFYHASTNHWCPEYDNMSFAEIVEKIVHSPQWSHFIGGGSGSRGAGCGDRLEASLYGRQIKRWFSIFNPTQFTIVPCLYITDPGNHGSSNITVVEKVWSTLGVANGKLMRDIQLNKHSHPELGVDIDASLLASFREVIYKNNSPESLADLFARYTGATLYGYNGIVGDVEAIAFWLQDNW